MLRALCLGTVLVLGLVDAGAVKQTYASIHASFASTARLLDVQRRFTNDLIQGAPIEVLQSEERRI